MSLANDIAARLLSSNGFALEPEPKWVETGEVPDFFATGPMELWIEVKALDDSKLFRTLVQKREWLREQAAKMGVGGEAHCWVSEDADQRQIKAACTAARLALDRWGRNDEAHQLYAIVPTDPEFGKMVEIRLDNGRSLHQIVAVKSASGTYGLPHFGDEVHFGSTAVFTDQDGVPQRADPFELHLEDDNIAVGMQLTARPGTFEISGVTPTGPARQSNTLKTVRIAAKKANSQFKNGLTYRSAPCLIIIFQDGPTVQDLRMFAAAFLGNLQMLFGTGELRFGRDGIWQPGSNRSTSAVAFVRNNAAPIVLRNPWAERPLLPNFLGWTEIAIDLDGKVTFPS